MDRPRDVTRWIVEFARASRGRRTSDVVARSSAEFDARRATRDVVRRRRTRAGIGIHSLQHPVGTPDHIGITSESTSALGDSDAG